MDAPACIRKLVVLTHEKFPLKCQRYYLWLLIDEWRKQGIEVEEQCGPGYKPADAVLLHVDLTEVPHEYLQAADRWPFALNRQLVDISKRVVSDNLVARDDPYTGPVVVKTNLNAGGGSETWLRACVGHNWLERVRSWWSWARPTKTAGRHGNRLASYDYPIYEQLCDVPAEIFENPHLVVEKYLPEFDGEYHWLRTMMCFGNSQCHGRYGSKARIVKSRVVTKSEELPESPTPALDYWIAKYGVDYGKLDFVIHNGRPVLLDVSRTPNFGGRKPTARTLTRARHLASGLTRLARRTA